MDLENQTRETPSDAFAQDGLTRGYLHHNRTSGHFCNRWERVALDSGDAHMNGLSRLYRDWRLVNLLECVQAPACPEVYPQQIARVKVALGMRQPERFLALKYHCVGLKYSTILDPKVTYVLKITR